MAVKHVNVADYRELIDACFQSHRDCYACVGDFEQRQGINFLRCHVADLKDATCKRVSARDKERASEAIRSCEFLIRTKQQQFDSADVAYTRMAFAGEWK